MCSQSHLFFYWFEHNVFTSISYLYATRQGVYYMEPCIFVAHSNTLASSPSPSWHYDTVLCSDYLEIEYAYN